MGNPHCSHVGNVIASFVILYRLFTCSILYFQAPSIVTKRFIERFGNNITPHVGQLYTARALPCRDFRPQRLRTEKTLDCDGFLGVSSEHDKVKELAENQRRVHPRHSATHPVVVDENGSVGIQNELLVIDSVRTRRRILLTHILRLLPTTALNV